MGTATLFLFIFVTSMILLVNEMQGNARVINYVGIIRGASQSLVKNELYGVENDAEIARLDDILHELQTGEGTQDLELLKDKAYQERLNAQAAEWELLKNNIYASREDPQNRDALYITSENYYVFADNTVSAAEVYAEGLATQIAVIEKIIIINIIVILVYMVIQITAAFRENRKLKKIAYIDPNTELPNKRWCEEKLSAGGILGDSTCCLMFDLNNLKIVNDTLGHKFGDALIKSFADLLRRTAPPQMFIGRLGGDEFIGIAENVSKEDVQAFIERLTTQASIRNEKQGFLISFACGYAFSSEHPGCTIKTLMDVADQNMYKNKAEIKSRQIANTKIVQE